MHTKVPVEMVVGGWLKGVGQKRITPSKMHWPGSSTTALHCSAIQCIQYGHWSVDTLDFTLNALVSVVGVEWVVGGGMFHTILGSHRDFYLLVM